MHARMHACTHARTHARMHACTHARMHARSHTCTHTRMHAPALPAPIRSFVGRRAVSWSVTRPPPREEHVAAATHPYPGGAKPAEAPPTRAGSWVPSPKLCLRAHISTTAEAQGLAVRIVNTHLKEPDLLPTLGYSSRVTALQVDGRAKTLVVGGRKVFGGGGVGRLLARRRGVAQDQHVYGFIGRAACG